MTKPRTGADGKGCAFAQQLHYVLDEAEKDGTNDIVSWLPHGRALMIHDKKRLEEEILPNWFRQTKFESFQRQLNMYGFRRLSCGQDKGAYYHELFLKGKPELVSRIKRQKVKGQGPRMPASAGTEPDFWAMTWMPPLGRDEKGAVSQPHEAAAAVAPAQPPPLVLRPELEMNIPAVVPVLTMPQVVINIPWMYLPAAIPLYQGEHRHPNPNAIQGFVMEGIAHVAPTLDPMYPVAAVQAHQFLMPVMAEQMPVMAGHNEFQEAHQAAFMEDPRYNVAVPGSGLLLPYPVVSTHVNMDASFGE